MNNVFTINVLTPGQRKARYGEASRALFLLLPILIWAVLAFGLYVYIYLPTCEQIQLQQMTLRDLNLELTRLSALRSKLEKQQALYAVASRERVDWSSKWVSVSLLIPEDIWITRVSFTEDDTPTDKPPVLEIYGQTISASNKETLDKIAIFIEGINRDASFSQDFFPVQFVYSQLQDEQKHIMEFKLSSQAKAAQRGDKQ